ncbi:MAG: glycosyltransferase [Clostridiales Family XIII bacterium]|jgi:glycosyltransferase involved in cell wall biosynthesis|nr:glycosyltransferase [Clostridiales Family XIII bacterium]
MKKIAEAKRGAESRAAPLVSVIIPVFKVERYLDACLHSVVGQRYENLEIILVDDGSPDNSGAMCDLWAEKDKRVKAIHKANEGLNYARKSGFEISAGEWICFLDSDDLLDPDAVRVLLDTAEREGVDMALCKVSWFESEADIERDRQQDTGKISAERDHAEAIRKSIRGWCGVPMMLAHSKLIRRDVLEPCDWALANYRVNEDEFETPQWYQAARRGIAYIDKTLCFYRQGNPNSLRGGHCKNDFDGRPLNKFDMFWEVYEKSGRIFGTHEFGRDLLFRLADQAYIFLNSYLDDGVLTASDLASVQKHIMPKMDDILGLDLPDERRRAFEAMKQNGIAGFASTRIQDLKKRNSELEEALKAFRQTLSWRCTKPLRAAKEALRGRGRRRSGPLL